MYQSLTQEFLHLLTYIHNNLFILLQILSEEYFQGNPKLEGILEKKPRTKNPYSFLKKQNNIIYQVLMLTLDGKELQESIKQLYEKELKEACQDI